jgi:hypothetical protein
MSTFSKNAVRRRPAIQIPRDESTWRIRADFLGEERIVDRKSEEPRNANPWLGRRGVRVATIAAIFLSIAVYCFCSPTGGPKQRQASVEEEWVGEEASGISGASEHPEGEAESSDGELEANIDTVGRELLLKVLEGNEEETKEIVTPTFLEDLEYKRAIIKGSDITKLQFERQGKYWVQGSSPCELLPSVEGERKKAGVARLRMVFMDGRWKLHDLNVR